MRPRAILAALAITAMATLPATAQRVVGNGGRALLLPRAFDDDASCASNRIGNGGFDRLNTNVAVGAAGVPLPNAPSWGNAWSGPPTARIQSHILGNPPSPLPGNFLNVRINNPNPDMHQFGAVREAALGTLTIPITVNTGSFTLTLRTAALTGISNSYPPTQVAIYGVKLASGYTLPAAPSTNAAPSNTALYGAGKVKLLGQIAIPATAGATWVNQAISFNSAALLTADDGSPMGGMTHILITGGIGAPLPPSSRTIGFDALCLRNPLV